MPTRRRADVKKTLLCATRFWSSGWRDRDNSIPTLSQGVRHVVRRQGFTPKQIDQAERALVREGRLEVGRDGAKSLRITDKGNTVSCANVKLSPWTDDPYPGRELTSRRSKRRRRRRRR